MIFIQALFYGILGYGNEPNGVLGNILNSHPMALKHLMPALMHFYIGLCNLFSGIWRVSFR
jgi:hypothetical protein